MASRSPEREMTDGRMSLLEHLVEARKRLTRAALSILLAAIAGFLLAPMVLTALRAPIVAIAESRNASLNYDSISGAFDLQMQIALWIGLILSSPVWLYQIFAFIVPALNRREKRYIFGFFFSAIPLFLSGCAAGYFVFPHMVELLAGFAAPEDTSIFLAKYYFDFAMKLIFVVGVGFVLPVFIVLLNFIGIWTAKDVLKSWRWAVLGITVFCAIATPAADIFSMFLLAIPMTLLYFLAILVCAIRDRVSAKRSARALASTDLIVDDLGSATA